jgi:quinol monooxygenase YgiN
MAKVRVFARAKAKAGKEMEVREILLGLVKASRAEDGVVFRRWRIPFQRRVCRC